MPPAQQTSPWSHSTPGPLNQNWISGPGRRETGGPAALQPPSFPPPGTTASVSSSTGTSGTCSCRECCAQQEKAAQGAPEAPWLERHMHMHWKPRMGSGKSPASVPLWKWRSGKDSGPTLHCLSPASPRWGNAGFFGLLFNIALFKRGTAPSYSLWKQQDPVGTAPRASFSCSGWSSSSLISSANAFPRVTDAQPRSRVTHEHTRLEHSHFST